jgi:hypothetical protein
LLAGAEGTVVEAAPADMQQVDLIPVPFSSLKVLIATASRFCGRESSLLRPTTLANPVRAGDVLRLALLAPEVRFPIDVNATVVAVTFKPVTLRVRYALADLSQVECALGHLYRRCGPELPVALDVATSSPAPQRCRLSSLSCEGATFDVKGGLEIERCTPDAEVHLELPHQNGLVDLPGHVAWLTPRPERTRLRVCFAHLGRESRSMLADIVYRFRLGAAPWTPRLQAPGL